MSNTDDRIEAVLTSLSDDELERLAQRLHTAHATYVIAEKVTRSHMTDKLLRALKDVRDGFAR